MSNMTGNCTQNVLYPKKGGGFFGPEPICRRTALTEWLRELAAKKKAENQHAYRTEQFGNLEIVERRMNDSCVGFAFAGIPIEKLSRKTLNVVTKIAILASQNRLNDLVGDRIEYLDMEITDV